MTISATSGKLHWNYFLALERDLELVTRYVEFTKPNFRAYSIELAHLLFAASSEVDVVAKLLCEYIAPAAPRKNINQYRAVLVPAINDLHSTVVYVPRYGLSFKPWSNWRQQRIPEWWRSYNNVKHQRDTYFGEATLKNALNSLGALLVLTFHYYSRILSPVANQFMPPKDTMQELQPQSTLLRLDDSYYYGHLLV